MLEAPVASTPPRYTNKYIYVYTLHAYIPALMCIYISAFESVQMWWTNEDITASRCIHIYTNTCIRTYICTHAYIHTYIHLHIYTYTGI